MLGSWTTIGSKPDAASTKAKLAKYRARITAARNQLNHAAAIPEQVKKYAKWVPNTCYAQLVQAECLLAGGDVEGASVHLDAGLALEGYSSLDRTEVLMWKAVLAYVAGDSQDSLKWCADLPDEWMEQCLELSPLEVGKDAQQHASVIRRRLLNMSSLGSDSSMPEYSPDMPSYRSRLVHVMLCCKACALEAEGDSKGAFEAYEQLLLFSRRSSKDGAVPLDALSAPLVERALIHQCTRSLARGDAPLAIAALRRGLSSSFALPPASRHRGRALLSSLLLHCCACRASEYEIALLKNELQQFNCHNEQMLSQQPRALEEACAILMLEDEDIAFGDPVAVSDNGGGLSWPCDDLACIGGTRTAYSEMAKRYRRSTLLQSFAANTLNDGSSVLRGALAAVVSGAPEEALSLIQVWLQGQCPCSWKDAEGGGTSRKALRKAGRNSHVAMLLAAKLCFNKLHRPELGLDYARRALEVRASARAHHAVAVGLLQCALAGCDIAERKGMYTETLNHLRATIQMEPSDTSARLHLSVVLALSGRLQAARQVLDADALSDDPMPLSLGLCAILCAALGEEAEALGTAEVMLERFPGDHWSMRLHAALQLEYGNPHSALETYFEIVADTTMESAFPCPTSEMGQSPRCLLARQRLNLSGGWEEGTALGGEGQHAVFEAWIDIVRAYRQGGMYQHASTAVAMARQVVAVHADVEYENGKISEACGQRDDAARSFTTALAIDPQHTASLIALASLRVSSEPETAVQLLRRAVRRDCTNADTWRLLSRSHHECGEEEQAREALLLSMELDGMTMPISLSFVPIFLH